MPIDERLPRGLLCYVPLSVNQGGITALTDVNGLITPPVALVLGRRYRVFVHLTLQSTVAGDTFGYTLVDGSTQVASAQNQATGNGVDMSLPLTFILDGDNALHTFKVRAERGAGTGTVTVVTGGVQFGITYGPAYIMVEDIGSSGI